MRIFLYCIILLVPYAVAFGFPDIDPKELKRITIHSDNAGDLVQEKGNMDVEMTIDTIHYMDKYSVAVFFTRDSDFFALVKYIKNAGKKVYIFSSKNNISQELRTGSDGYFDVLHVDENIWGRDLKHRDST